MHSFMLCCLISGEEFSKVQKEVYDIIKGRMLVGHALHNDFQVSLVFIVVL